MADKHKQKEVKGTDYIEKPEALQQEISRTEEFIKSNRKVVFILGGLVALVIAGVFGYKYFTNMQDENAQKEIFQAQYYFEEGEFDNALNGDGNSYGFLEIAEKYSMSKAANLSHYYAGVIYLKKGEFQNAIDHLKQFSSDDLLIQGKAYALTGDAYMEMEQYSEAANYYGKAASFKSNKFVTPQYLMKKALAQEKAGNISGAAESYAKIVEEYPTAYEFQTARKHKARLETMASK